MEKIWEPKSVLQNVKLFNSATSLLDCEADNPRIATATAIVNLEVSKICEVRSRYHQWHSGLDVMQDVVRHVSTSCIPDRKSVV